MLVDSPVGATHASPLPKTSPLPTRPRGPQRSATKRINERRGPPVASVWQRNYYEHIIRDEGELERIRQYILDNPACWAEDRGNPEVVTITHWRR